MSRPIVTLTTDFGVGSPYVAEMKGVLLSLCDDLQLVDISHSVPPQDIRSGALILGDSAELFPRGTIHVAVVDPGVGTKRRLIGVECAGRIFLGPDNGIFSRVLAGNRGTGQVELSERRFWRDPPSNTFHGRDILAPVAAHCALGVPLAQLGPRCMDLVELDWPEAVAAPEGIRGECLVVDTFGNVISNISREFLELHGHGPWQVELAGRIIGPLVSAYGEGKGGQLVALFGSRGRLEIAQVNGSAAQELQVQPGTPISVYPARHP